MPMSHKKVRFAQRAPGLLLLAGGAMALSACGGQGPDKEPAAEVVLSRDADAAPPTVDAKSDDGDTPGFSSVAPTGSPAASVTLPAPDGQQSVTGTIVDFICGPDTPVSSEDTTPPAACELVIRTDARGDRRLLSDVAPCDAWTARGNLPQGIRGLKADAWITLADTYDAAGEPTGRVAKVTRLNVAYTKTP